MGKKPSNEVKSVEAGYETDFLLFSTWYCTPKSQRPPEVQTIREYAKSNNIAPRTLYEWMKTKKFTEFTEQYFKDFIAPRLTDVRNALFERTQLGDSQAIRLFFEYEQAWVKPDTKTEAEASSELASAIMEAIDRRNDK